MDLLKLVKELNETMTSDTNPFPSNKEEWPFGYSTNGDIELIELFGQRLFEGGTDTLKETIATMSEELDEWIAILKSSAWALKQLSLKEL